ncbi:MAG: PIG-L family deacetylase [Acidobacteria bacterium]|nr:PIG-L family deacetylase [Acidobacteriota bacterium]
MSKHIVSIHAHPDDAEILAGGTLAILAARGHKITIVTMTPGDKGSDILSPDETATLRRKEGATAAALIGASYLCAEFRDLEVFNDNESRRRVVEIVRQLRPDIVLTSSPADYLCDHESTSTLVRDALFGAPAPNYLTGANNPAATLKAIPHLYYMDAIGGADRDGHPIMPDFVIDVGGVFETKSDMLKAHQSQRAWLQRQHGMDDYIETMTRWTRICGKRAHLDYGEGFRRYKGHPYPQSPLLEDLLAGLIHPLPTD